MVHGVDPAAAAVDPVLACVGGVDVADEEVDHVQVEDGIVWVVLC